MDVKQHGIYILSDLYFQKYDTGRMMQNKQERRPHFFALEIGGILWMIPLSSNVNKYKSKISEWEKRRGRCLYYHIGNFAGRQSAFLIGDMLPVTPEYIAREYTISGIPYVVRDESLYRPLVSKAKRYLLLVRQGRITPFVDILAIEKDLLSN